LVILILAIGVPSFILFCSYYDSDYKYAGLEVNFTEYGRILIRHCYSNFFYLICEYARLIVFGFTPTFFDTTERSFRVHNPREDKERQKDLQKMREALDKTNDHSKWSEEQKEAVRKFK